MITKNAARSQPQNGQAPTGRRKHNMRRRVIGLVVGLMLMLGLSLVMPSAAQAYAYGCTGYGSGIMYQGYYVKNGTWCGQVRGSGTYVQTVDGNFYVRLPKDSMCNWRVRADFYRADGSYYGGAYGYVHWGCSLANQTDTIYLNQYVPRGFVNVSLLSNNQTIAVVRHNIF